MPSNERSYCTETVTLWPALPGQTDTFGQDLLGPGREIQARYETGTKEMTKPDGTPQAVSATLLVLVPLVVGSVVWRGRLADWPGTSAGLPNKLMRVAAYEEIPDVKGRAVERTAGLVFSKDTLPAGT